MVSKDIELKNIKVGSNIALRNVFFNTGKWEVKSDSYAEILYRRGGSFERIGEHSKSDDDLASKIDDGFRR